MQMKTEPDGESCWSVWAKCDCCEDGWHWIMTSMGPNAEQDAKEWMENMTKELQK